MDKVITEFLKGAEFLSLPPAKQRYLREMISMMEGRAMNEKVQILLSYGFKMQNEGMQLSREESAMLIQVLQAHLTPEEKKQFEQISRLLG